LAARRLPNERQRLLALTIVAGGACGLAAVTFHVSIGWLESLLIDRANAAHGHTWIVWTVLSPGLGGLIVGLGLNYWAPADAGSGIPQVKVAFALRYGLITSAKRLANSFYAPFRLAPAHRLAWKAPPCRFVRASAASLGASPG
jgi:chloride channel protein, CIC family